MVTIFTLIVKLANPGISLQQMTNNSNTSFPGSPADHCAHCDRSRLTVRSESYERQITDWSDGKRIDTWIKTRQYECECGKTHVLLPSLIIPYCLYSLPFMIRVLYDYFGHKDTVQGICEKYDISIPTLYRWKEKFLADKEIWLKRLQNAETSATQFLELLMSDDIRGEQFRDFSRETYPHRQFLQTHKYAYSHRYL